MADGPPSQLSIDALHTATPIAISRPSSLSSIHALHTATPTARYSTMHIYRRQMDPPVIQVQMPCIPLHPLLDPDPPVNQAYMPCIPLHPLLDMVQCIYIYRRQMDPPSQ